MFSRALLGGLVLASIAVVAAAEGELYRWVDEQGNVQFSDQAPPPTARDVQQLKQGGLKPGDPQVPYQLQQATRNFPVSLYVTDCGSGCTQARELLAKRGIPHTEYDANAPAFQESLNKLTGGELVVPVLKVGKNVLTGFEAGRWNAALDAAGYPATALVKVTPTKAKPPAPPAQPAVAPPAADGAQAPSEQGENEN